MPAVGELEADQPGIPARSSDPVEQTAHGRRSAGQVARDIALFFAAPFITLAYLPLFPIIGAVKLLRNPRQFWLQLRG